MKRNIYYLSLIILGLSLTINAVAQSKNGFDLSHASIDIKDIFSGGPPRDGIPSINSPKFIAINQVDFLKDNDIVIGLSRGKIAKAYPTRILIWHEIVNDIINGEAVAITYCPLCGTAMVFNREVNGKLRQFGVSGLLYQSDVLMYDRETESLWSQLAMQAVSGKALGTKLNWLESEHLTWKAWKEKYPQGQVLSTDTGYQRNYNSEAYSSYFASDDIMFPVPITRNELAKKAWVLGVIIDAEAKAYPLDDLIAKKIIYDQIANKKITIEYDAVKKYPQVRTENGENILSVMVYWFAWQAFYPQTSVWKLN